MVIKVKGLVKQGGGAVYIYFPQGQMPLRGQAFKKFLELNELQEYLIVFVSSAPEGAEERELILPTPHKRGWQKLREALRSQMS